jgi:hypothetical protein
MATTPDKSKLIEFAIAALAPQTPLALSAKARPNFDIESTLPTAEELTMLDTPNACVTFIKNCLLLAQVSTNLWSGAAKTPSYYRDITSVTERHTVALSTSLAKTATLLLTATQDLCLQCARNKVWTGATHLEKKVIDIDDQTQVKVTRIDLLKSFHEVSIEAMITVAKAFWADPNALQKSDDGISHHYICKCFGD